MAEGGMMAEETKERRMLTGIANIAQRYLEAQQRFQEAKEELHNTDEYEEYKEAQKALKEIRDTFLETGAVIVREVQLALPIGEIVSKVADEINAGALDSKGIKCTASVGRPEPF